MHVGVPIYFIGARSAPGGDWERYQVEVRSSAPANRSSSLGLVACFVLHDALASKKKK